MKAFALLILGVIACGGAPPAQRPGAPQAGSASAPAGKHPEMLAIMEHYLASPMSSADDLDKIRDFVVGGRRSRPAGAGCSARGGAGTCGRRSATTAARSRF